jgi:hypothetical protein
MTAFDSSRSVHIVDILIGTDIDRYHRLRCHHHMASHLALLQMATVSVSVVPWPIAVEHLNCTSADTPVDTQTDTAIAADSELCTAAHTPFDTAVDMHHLLVVDWTMASSGE